MFEELKLKLFEKLKNDKSGKLDVAKVRVFLRKEGIRISSWKAYQIKGNIESEHPEMFDEQ